MRSPRALPQRRQRHPDRAAYIVYVLWMIGHSRRTIAKALGLRPNQVAGIVRRSEYAERAAMTPEEIRRHLKELESIRFDGDGAPLDGGALDRITFVPRPLDARQHRGALKRRMRNAG